MADDGALEPISLGFSCEVKYQLSRNLYYRKFPQGQEEDFRRMVMTHDRDDYIFERHVFDFQITPWEALIAYLERDFRGVFERRDLRISADGSEVEHAELLTRHPHEFHPIDGVLDEAAIDAQYDAARGKFEHLAGKFRRHLASGGPTLYVFNQIRILTDAERLMALLRAANPDHRFRILFVDYDGADQWLDSLQGQVFKAWTGPPDDKEGWRKWEGNDARWEQLLRPFDLRAPYADDLTLTFDESRAAQPQAPPAAPPSRRGLLARLFNR